MLCGSLISVASLLQQSTGQIINMPMLMPLLGNAPEEACAFFLQTVRMFLFEHCFTIDHVHELKSWDAFSALQDMEPFGREPKEEHPWPEVGMTVVELK